MTDSNRLLRESWNRFFVATIQNAQLALSKQTDGDKNELSARNQRYEAATWLLSEQADLIMDICLYPTTEIIELKNQARAVLREIIRLDLSQSSRSRRSFLKPIPRNIRRRLRGRIYNKKETS